MKQFANNIKVQVTEKAHPLAGQLGTVVRLCISDNGAWVKMDNALPEELESFPKEDARHHNVLLYPDQCSKAKV